MTRLCMATRVGLLLVAGIAAGSTSLVALSPSFKSPMSLEMARMVRQSQWPLTRARQTQEVTWVNEGDGTRLHGSLVLPSGGDGAGPGVVVHSIAGTDPLVDRLLSDGYAVLLPVRRGFVEVEPLLRATYEDLGADIEAAVRYLESRPEVDEGAVGLIAQGDDAPPALVSAAMSRAPVPMVVMGPPAYGGVETFQREQRSLAERDGATHEELAALDRYVEGIADIVLNEVGTFDRVYRLQALRAGSTVQLPGNASFPGDERQARFFASALWHDRLAFEPRPALARLRSPVLVLLGLDDPNVSAGDWLETVESALSTSESDDARACLIPGRTRHAFTDDGMSAILEWLGQRVAPGDPTTTATAPGERPSACLDGVPGR